MKIYKKRIITLVLIILSTIQIFLLLIPFTLSQTSDIDYTFNKEIFFEKDDLYYDSLRNLRNPQSFTDTYNATYSFTNDIIGSEPLDMVDIIDTLVIERIDEHSKITNSSGNIGRFTNEFTLQVNGIVEFWIFSIDTTHKTNFILVEGVSGAIQLFFDDDKLKYSSSGFHDITDVNDDIWYHIKVEFECGGGSFKGLAPDTFFLYLNGIQYGPFPFTLVKDNIDKFVILNQDPVDVYVDAIDYSWTEGYYENRNLIPLIYTDTNILHTDLFNFTYSAVDTIYNIGADNPSGWNDIEFASGDRVNIDYYGNDVVQKFHIDVFEGLGFSGDKLGTNKIFDCQESKVNITFEIIFNQFETSLESVFDVEIQSDDSTIISLIQFQNQTTSTIDMYYYDGSSFNLLQYNFKINDVNKFNLYIDYDINLCVLRVIKNNTYNNTFYFPTIVNGKIGIDRIKLYQRAWENPGSGNPSKLITLINNIGVYENGKSLSTDFSFLTISLINSWFSQKHNLLQFNGLGYFNIKLKNNNPSALPFVQIIENINLTNEFININVFDTFFGFPSSLEPYFQFNILFYNFTYSDLIIKGLSLNSKGNKFLQNLEHNNTNINENYFYVDDSNILRYTHTSDDSFLEYIQISFNITQISSTDRFLGFSSTKTGNSYGNFIVQFNDATANSIEFINTKTNYQTIITQNKTIIEFKILISDNNEFTSGSTFGNINNIILRYSDIPITIIILTLIGVMIPLIIILIPSLAISTSYGKNLIVPLFILMSVICLVGNLIPIWLFFIIAFSVISFLFINKESFKELI